MLARYSGTKKERLLSKWLSQYTNFIKQEETFRPQFLKRYKRGEIIMANLGYRLGSEEGGPHYAIVLDKQNSEYSDIITILPMTSKKPTSRPNKYTLDLGSEIYDKLYAKYMEKFHHSLKSIDISPKETPSGRTFTLSVSFDTTEADKVMDEINSMKEGSIALLSQITSISKMRIMKPKRTTDAFSGICLSSESLDLIDASIKSLYLGS